jgi:D-alanyl-lipoteichoic acid acyltransferase DltB (MBOAT superfamily)
VHYYALAPDERRRRRTQIEIKCYRVIYSTVKQIELILVIGVNVSIFISTNVNICVCVCVCVFVCVCVCARGENRSQNLKQHLYKSLISRAKAKR